MDTWIIQRCRSVARRQVGIWLAIAVIVVLTGAFYRRYVVDFLTGPHAATESDLAGYADAARAPHSFVRVAGSKMVDTGVQQISVRTRAGSEVGRSVSAQYYVLVMGDRLLLVKAGEQAPPNEIAGALEPIPGDVQSQIFTADMESGVRARFYPFLLATSGFRYPGYWALGILIVLLGILVKFGRPAILRMRDPQGHPAARRLQDWGDPITLSGQIEQERRDGVRQRVGSTHLTDHYIIRDGVLTFDVLRMEDVLWAYKKVTKHYTNFIPTGKTYQALLICYGGNAEISGKEAAVDQLLAFVATRTPWAVFGFDKELETLWNKNTADFCAGVEQRRQEHQAQKASAKSSSAS